jgi:eukaryotic-like serine/threonine-protein kinase
MLIGPGARLGPYEIVSVLGTGGMGQVWRARDSKLGRDVAIKVLPSALAGDPERLARFAREAQVLASLNHPNIAAIYHLEEVDGASALVMELVEGETLADRIARGPIPIDEALPIAKQIAEALEAAHEQGIVHRDLKPANIKVRPDGTVKVLDFGLAKLAELGTATASPSALSLSPTITSPAMMTGVGVLLGTAAYMSPEQARGKSADKRADIWAFGCVLYQMLTGQAPFAGEDVNDTLANVMKRDPDWTALPSELSSAVRALLRRCLEKDRRKRVADIAAAVFVFDEHANLDRAATVLPQRSVRRRLFALTAGPLLVAVIATALTWLIARPADRVAPRVSRLLLPASGDAALNLNGTDRDLAITPDGSRIVYVGNRGTQLFVRALEAVAPTLVLTGTPRGLFISPDGQWIGFAANNSVLAKVAVTGGAAVTLTTLDGFPQGATWLPDNTIIFATNNAAGLERIGASGGPITILTQPDRALGEADHVWPEVLPGGRAVLFTIRALTGGEDASQIAVLDLQTGVRKVVLRGGSHAHYVESGHLVYAAAGTLRAVSFDLATLQTRGTPVMVVSDVTTTSFGAVDAMVAADGTLVYSSGGRSMGADAPRVLVWVDRQGQETPIAAPPRAYMYPRLSPDGTRIAVFAGDQQLDLWMWDLARVTLTRLTFNPGLDVAPVWTPDGRRLVFASDRRGGQFNLFVQSADGTGQATRVAESASQQNATGISRDGTQVVFDELSTTRQHDLRLLTLTPVPHVQALIETPFDERGGVISPDGRWLAYESNTSGRLEVYVRPFPNVGDGQWQVSNAGGMQPLWSGSGRELFYVAPDDALLTVAVDPRGSTWNAGTVTKVVDGRYYSGRNVFTPRQFDVSRDGKRFLMIKDGSGTDHVSPPASIIVVQHWTEELKRLVPTK